MKILLKIVSAIETVISAIANYQSIKLKKNDKKEDKEKLKIFCGIMVIVIIVIILFSKEEILVDLIDEKGEFENAGTIANEINNENMGTIASEISNENTGIIASEINNENTGIIASEVNIANYGIKEKEYNDEINGKLIFDDICSGYHIAIANDTAYLALNQNLNEWIPLNLSNTNDISIKIDNIYADILSYEPCQGIIYSFNPDGCGDSEHQIFFRELDGSTGLQRLYYTGTDLKNIVPIIDSNKYLKLEAGDIESCLLNFSCMNPGIYTMRIRVDYYIKDEHQSYYTEKIKIYLGGKNRLCKELSLGESEFIFNQLYSYLDNSKVPKVYIDGIEREVAEHNNREYFNLKEFSIYDKRIWESYIACHYTFWSEDNQSVDLHKYLQAISTNHNFEHWFSTDNMCRTNISTLDNYAYDIGEEIDDNLLPWNKIKSDYGDSDEFMMPFYSLKDYNPYAKISDIKIYGQGIVTIYGYVQNDKKGGCKFKCSLEEEDYHYHLNSITYYK